MEANRNQYKLAPAPIYKKTPAAKHDTIQLIV